MVRNKQRIVRIFLCAILFLFSIVLIFGKRVNAGEVNKVYFKDLVVDASDSGLVYAEIFALGQAGDKVTVKYHTVGVTAIQDLDYVGISNKVDITIGSSGEGTYKIAIKCLNNPENRAKFKIVDDDKSFGRYFNICLDDAINAEID